MCPSTNTKAYVLVHFNKSRNQKLTILKSEIETEGILLDGKSVIILWNKSMKNDTEDWQ